MQKKFSPSRGCRPCWSLEDVTEAGPEGDRIRWFTNMSTQTWERPGRRVSWGQAPAWAWAQSSAPPRACTGRSSHCQPGTPPRCQTHPWWSAPRTGCAHCPGCSSWSPRPERCHFMKPRKHSEDTVSVMSKENYQRRETMLGQLKPMHSTSLLITAQPTHAKTAVE